ncbi:hypothetical protein [Anaerococcus vaginimassiliensis]|uniref:hypothetical protein n=1 Tax=Anaerococcus vaginimassiliensis TaxID=2042308 RepID=UPI00103041CF|nr:hypothetical protein [Anaerococcus vaginimassiliensis]
MINFEKAQWADNIIVILKNGEKIQGSGAGILIAEDFDDSEYQYDTFYVNNSVKSIALKIEDIEDIKIIKA